MFSYWAQGYKKLYRCRYQSFIILNYRNHKELRKTVVNHLGKFQHATSFGELPIYFSYLLFPITFGESRGGNMVNHIAAWQLADVLIFRNQSSKTQAEENFPLRFKNCLSMLYIPI